MRIVCSSAPSPSRNGSQNRARALTLSGKVRLMTTRPRAVNSRSRNGSQMSPAVLPPFPWTRMTFVRVVTPGDRSRPRPSGFGEAGPIVY